MSNTIKNQIEEAKERWYKLQEEIRCNQNRGITGIEVADFLESELLLIAQTAKEEGRKEMVEKIENINVQKRKGIYLQYSSASYGVDEGYKLAINDVLEALSKE